MDVDRADPSRVRALLAHTDVIAQVVIARCAEEIPAYRRLPASVLEGDLVANAEALIGVFLTAVSEGRAPTDEELRLPVSWGAERARDGLPLEAVLRIYPIGAREAWRIIAGTMLPPEQRDAMELVEQLLDFLGAVLPLVTTAFLREQQDLSWEKREGRQSLAAALLDGRATNRLAGQVESTLAEHYAVVVYRLPRPRTPDTTREATRLTRAIQDALDADTDVLWSFERDLGVLLVPAPAPGTAGEQVLRAKVPTVLATVDAVAHTGTLAAAAVASGHADIPRAHREAVAVLELAERLRRRSGVFWLSDLAIEFQLAQPGPARDYLASLLDPVADHPHLAEALRAFVASGYNRGEAATALSIHRNTLNYRLGRINTLTGLDPTQPADARTLAAALVAHDIGTAEAQPSS